MTIFLISGPVTVPDFSGPAGERDSTIQKLEKKEMVPVDVAGVFLKPAKQQSESFDATLRQFSFFPHALISCDAVPVIRIRHAAKIHRALPVQTGIHKHTDTPLFALKETHECSLGTIARGFFMISHSPSRR